MLGANVDPIVIILGGVGARTVPTVEHATHHGRRLPGVHADLLVGLAHHHIMPHAEHGVLAPENPYRQSGLGRYRVAVRGQAFLVNVHLDFSLFSYLCRGCPAVRQSARHGGVLFLPVVGALRDGRVGYLTGIAHQPLYNVHVHAAVEHQHGFVHRPLVGLCVGTVAVISAAAPQLVGVGRFEGSFVRKAQRGQ